MRILVAEDNAFNRAVLLAALKKGGHEVMVAVDGQEALDAYTHHPVDLVLLDLEMPGLGGLEVAQAIRARGGRVPIVALTGREDAGDACRAAGMNGHLTKPVRTATLWADIATAVAERRTTVEPTAILDEAGGDRALVHRLIALFREQSAELLERLQAAPDQTEAARAAHALKSVCSHFSQGAAYSLCAEIEGAGERRIALETALVAAVAALDAELAAAFPPERRAGS